MFPTARYNATDEPSALLRSALFGRDSTLQSLAALARGAHSAGGMAGTGTAHSSGA
jgi:hypothetical protein